MTLTTTTNKVTYVGNGATTVFSYAFPILDEDDLVVTITENGIDTELGSGVYSVTGIGNPAGGAVTYPLSGDPIPASKQITILRQVPTTQETNLTNQSTLYPEILEQALDRLAMMNQQNAEQLTRALLFSIADPSTGVLLPTAAERAGKYLTFDGDGNPGATSTIDPGSVTISAFWEATLALASAVLARNALGVGVTGTLGQAAADTILGNPTGSTADPGYNSLASYIARLGDTRGSILRRGASAWEALAVGADGTFLGSDGTDTAFRSPPIGEGMFRNLSVEATSDTGISVSVDWITLANASSQVRMVRTVSSTITTSSAGANGLDTGSMAANTWYAVWIIHNPTTAVTAAMLSTSASAPTMPSGYTFKHRVGWMRTQSGSANLRRIRQKNTEAQYVVTGAVAAPTLSNGSNTVVGDHVPTTAVMIHVQANITAWASEVSVRPNSNISSANSPIFHSTGSSNINTNGDTGGNSAWFVLEGTTVVATVSGSATARVYGWKDSI